MTDFKAFSQMKKIMGAYYMEAKQAERTGAKKICWITSGGPVEFLQAMDVIPIYPENYAAMCAASRQSLDLIQHSESMGYCADICSYARTDFGQVEKKGGPLFGLPKPDMLLCATNICKTVQKWYEALSRRYGVPLFNMDIPFIHDGVTGEIVDYVADQFLALEKWLAENCGKPFDREKFIVVLEKSRIASKLWQTILDYAKRRPSPINSHDTFIHMAPIVTLRGTDLAIDYYKALEKEVREMAENGVGSIPNEKYRLLWDNLPVWDRIKYMSGLFEKNDACLVAATYTAGWGASAPGGIDAADMNRDNLYKELARVFAGPYVNRDLPYRIEYFKELVRDFSLDGIVLHANRSCKPYSVGQYQLKNEISRLTGVPSVVLEADMNDPRVFSEGQIETRVEAFIEKLEESRAEA